MKGWPSPSFPLAGFQMSLSMAEPISIEWDGFWSATFLCSPAGVWKQSLLTPWCQLPLAKELAQRPQITLEGKLLRLCPVV